jgi:hypothetical protein
MMDNPESLRAEPEREVPSLGLTPLSRVGHDELARRAREQLRLALGHFRAPQAVIRTGYGQPGWPAPRRDVDEVIDDEVEEA